MTQCYRIDGVHTQYEHECHYDEPSVTLCEARQRCGPVAGHHDHNVADENDDRADPAEDGDEPFS